MHCSIMLGNFRFPLGSLLVSVSIIWASLFRALVLHQFSIDFGMEFGATFDVLKIPFRSLTQPAKPSKTITLTMTLRFLTLVRNIVFDDFHDLFQYLFRNEVADFWHLC